MSTRISSLSILTTRPSTTSPCLKLRMSASCSASSSSIVGGSGPTGCATATGASRASGSVVASTVTGAGSPACSLGVSTASVASASSAVGSMASAVASVGTAVSVCVAGSSATTSVATVASGAWSASEALASGSGAVPPGCSSVNSMVSLVRCTTPENQERPEQRSSRFRDVRVVRGVDAPRSAPSRVVGSGLLFIFPARGPRESSTRVLAATIGRPCPSCPT